MKSIIDNVLNTLKYHKGTKFRWIGRSGIYEITNDPEFGNFKSVLGIVAPAFKADIALTDTEQKWNDYVCSFDAIELA